MRKLEMKVDELSVESFTTVPEMKSLHGTVQANSYTVNPYPSCAPTCGASPPPPTDICGLDDAERPTIKACCV